jgi:hypothetical protein
MSDNGIVPEYSQASPFNATSTMLLLLWHENGEFHLYDGEGSHIRELVQISGLDEPRWSRTEPNILYYHTGNRLWRYDVGTDTDELVHQFAEYSSISFGGGQLDLSDNNRTTVIGDNRYISVFELDTGVRHTVLDTNDSPMNGQAFDNANITPDGDGFMVAWDAAGTGRAQGTELFNVEGVFQRQLLNTEAHGDMGRDVDGTQVYFACNSNTNPQQPPGWDNAIVKVRLSDGQVTGLLALDWDLEVHVSARAGDGWAYVSTFDATDPDPDSKWFPYYGEVFRVRADGSVVERIVHHRSRANAYWKQPHAAISMRGDKLIYGSDFQIDGQPSDYADTYLVNLPGDGMKYFVAEASRDSAVNR